jgi:hypothetical protein
MSGEHVLRWASALLGCAILVTAVSLVQADEPTNRPPSPQAVQRMRQTIERAMAEKQARMAGLTPAQRKIEDHLLRTAEKIRLLRAQRSGESLAEACTIDRLIQVNDVGEIQCYVLLDGVTAAHVQGLQDLGFRTEIASPSMNLVQGWAPSERLEGIAQLGFVKRIKLPAYAVNNCEGLYCTEGDAIHRADLVRSNLGVTGAGVKVGVISDGVDHRNNAAATGDLPETSPGSGVADIQVYSSLPGNGDEGTAMLEIIHDLAPDADLAFAGPWTSAEMVQAINWLATTAGCDVIVDDVLFLDEPIFEDGAIAQTARQAVTTNDRVYVSAAGNWGDDHYQGMFSPLSGYPDLHDFGAGDPFFDVLVPPYGSLIILLQWNDRFGASGNDYDLYLFDDVGGLLGVSEEVQNGGGDPLELVIWTNDTGSTTWAYGLVFQHSGAARTLELFVYGGNVIDPAQSSADAVYGHAAVSEVVSVGAISASDPGHDTIESFSARGPATLYFPSYQVRQVPFCAAIDGVTVSGAGGFYSPFYGTSAAAPHAAAIAALYLSAYPDATPEQVRNVLASGAIDLGAGGFDYTFGYGRLDATNSVVPPVTTFTLQVQSTPITGVTMGASPIQAGGQTNYAVTLEESTSVTLTAPQLTRNYEFQRWQLDGTPKPDGELSVSLVMDANHTTLAVYQALPEMCTLSVSSTPITGIAITGNPPAAGGTTNYTWSAECGSDVALTAPATALVGDVEYEFVGWLVDSVLQDTGLTAVIDLDDDRSARAIYQQKPPNACPVLRDIEDYTAVAGAQSLLFAVAYDQNPGDTLTFSIDGHPSFVTMDTATGVITIDPDLGDAGTYPDIEVCVSDDGEPPCMVCDTFTLTVGAIKPVSANAGPDKSIPLGECTVLEGGGADGVPPYSYAWSPPTGLDDPNVARPNACPDVTTVYTLTVTDDTGQQDTDSVTVTVGAAVAGLAVDAGPDHTIQSGDCVVLTATVSGGEPPYVYAWLPIAGLSNPNVLRPSACPDSTRTYTLTVTDNQAQQQSDEVTVTVAARLTADAGPDYTIEPGGCVVLQGSGVGGSPPYAYSWSPTDGLSDAIIAAPTACPAITTGYMLTVTDSLGRKATDNVLVLVESAITQDQGTSRGCSGMNLGNLLLVWLTCLTWLAAQKLRTRRRPLG